VDDRQAVDLHHRSVEVGVVPVVVGDRDGIESG
jgi:hypothetical protein